MTKREEVAEEIAMEMKEREWDTIMCGVNSLGKNVVLLQLTQAVCTIGNELGATDDNVPEDVRNRFAELWEDFAEVTKAIEKLSKCCKEMGEEYGWKYKGDKDDDE